MFNQSAADESECVCTGRGGRICSRAAVKMDALDRSYEGLELF